MDRSLLRGFAVWLVQLVLVWLVGRSFESLSTWDGGWYLNILENGYRSPFPHLSRGDFGNVAFFPGFPAAAALVNRIFGSFIEVTPRQSLVVTAQLAALGFHLVLFWGLDRVFRFSARAQWIAGAFWALQPGAFFLFVGYSESLFLLAASVLAFGYLYLFGRSQTGKGDMSLVVILASAGIVLTATRLVGVVFCGIGFWVWIYLRAVDGGTFTRRGLMLAAGLSVAGVLGVGSFFAYCHWKFGAWDLYFRTIRAGWDFATHFEWASFFRYMFWKGMFPLSSGNAVGRLELFLVIGLSSYFFLHRKRFSERAVALASFGGFFSIVTLGLLSSGRLGGLFRYLLPSVMLLIPALTEWVERYSSGWQRRGLLLLAVVLGLLQISFISLFARTLWVA